MPDAPPPQPTLTDGVVTLRPWRDEDVAEAVAGHDEEIAHWFGSPAPTPSLEQQRAAIEDWRRGYAEGRSRVNFVVEADGHVAGSVEVQDRGNGTGRLSWTVYSGHRRRGYGTRAVRLLVDYSFEALGLQRVEAEVEPGNERSLRVATRAGLHREGVKRVVPGTGDRRETSRYVVLARLATDPPISDPNGFRSLLNASLPRKRAIAQMLLRDHHDRVLLCQLTYKRDWDLPGGVVEVGESPQQAAVREVEEELGLTLPAGELVLTDWLPPWGGWDDAICLVFDGGVHHSDVLHDVVHQEREIRSTSFCTPEEVRSRATDFTARRVEAALRNLTAVDRSDRAGADRAGPDGVRPYTESGR